MKVYQVRLTGVAVRPISEEEATEGLQAGSLVRENLDTRISVPTEGGFNIVSEHLGRTLPPSATIEELRIEVELGGELIEAVEELG